MERYFQTIPDIGKLFIEEILFEFDKEPIVFVCRNDKKNRYLCLCTDSIESYSWMVTPISIDTLIELLMDKIAILQAFRQSPNEVYILDKLDDKINIRKYKFKDIPQDELPDENEKLENKNVNGYLSKLYGEQNVNCLKLIKYDKAEASMVEYIIMDDMISNTEKNGIINMENFVVPVRFSVGKKEKTNNKSFYIKVKQDNWLKTKHYNKRDKKAAVTNDWSLTLV